jgi:hypothetical protein
VHGGDANAQNYGVLNVVEAVAEGILELDDSQLHSAHCSRFNSALDCYDLPWLDLNSTYADCSTTPFELRNDYERLADMPFYYAEGIYEYEYDWTDICMRSQAYWSLLGGAIGHFYGNGRIWDFPAGWAGAVDSPGAGSMRHFGALLASRNWTQLVPDYDHSVLLSGYGDINSGNYAACARSEDGTTVLRSRDRSGHTDRCVCDQRYSQLHAAGKSGLAAGARERDVES